MSFGVQPHRLRPEFCFHRLDKGEFVRRIFMDDMDRSLARRTRDEMSFRIENVGINAIANRERLTDDLAGVRIHHNE